MMLNMSNVIKGIVTAKQVMSNIVITICPFQILILILNETSFLQYS